MTWTNTKYHYSPNIFLHFLICSASPPQIKHHNKNIVLHSSNLVTGLFWGERRNCVTQLELYTLDKLSSTIFCCLWVPSTNVYLNDKLGFCCCQTFDVYHGATVGGRSWSVQISWHSPNLEIIQGERGRGCGEAAPYCAGIFCWWPCHPKLCSKYYFLRTNLQQWGALGKTWASYRFVLFEV